MPSSNPLLSILKLPLAILGLAVGIVEGLLFRLVDLYDIYCYSPIHKVNAPIVERLPRTITLFGHQYTIFSANIVSWSRTLLVVPIAYCLKYGHPWGAFWCVVLHDYLDHLDGIVARVQKQKYGQLDDPLLGGFMDAFCDKIVNVMSLWTVLVVTNFEVMTVRQSVVLVSSCVVIIIYEFAIGVIRVQDYFQAYYMRRYKKLEVPGKSSTAAVMEGKLKEKLESMGIAGLGLAQGSVGVMNTWAGPIGVICLILSVRLAHASLSRKLQQRQKIREIVPVETESEPAKIGSRKQLTDEDLTEKLPVEEETQNKDSKNNEPESTFRKAHMRHNSSQVDIKDLLPEPLMEEGNNDDSNRHRPECKTNEIRKIKAKLRPKLERRMSLQYAPVVDGRVDKVYTIGCFDLFHRGHVVLMQNMRALGKQVIVGVHDSRSYFLLKKKLPMDSTAKRMLNVKRYADQVFCIAHTDPSTYLSCAVHLAPTETALYVRGDDMPNFPARNVCEALMPIHFLSYTEGVSSTKLRKEFFNREKVLDIDEAHLFY